jgi:hypothetical protein
VSRVAQELGKHPTTINRWIVKGKLAAKDFPYQVRSGAWETVQAVACSSVESHRDQQQFDDGVIRLLMQARKIPRASAERNVRRLHTRLTRSLGHAPTAEDIRTALSHDPQVRRYWKRAPRQRPEEPPA